MLDRAGRRALVAGEEVSLTPTEFQLLDLLVSEGRAVLRREEIAGALWGRSTLADAKRVDRCVCRLREKVEVDARHPQWIQTVHGVGYRFESPL
jgi:DNA-binding response OmpR family regulator